MKQLLSALIFIFISASVFAQTDDNEIFIEQTGDTLTLFIEQEGEGNKIGLDDFSTTSSTMAITGTNLSFAESTTFDVDFTGSTNTVDFDQGSVADGDRLDLDLILLGSSNVFNIDVESTDAIWNFDISGSYADINTEQSDGVDHKIDFILDGDNADIDIIQTNGTCPVALSCSGIIYMDVTSDNATITILQED